MRASVLHQPWASLVALGLKPLETRGQRTHVRGEVLITAAKGWPGGKRQALAREQAILDWLWNEWVSVAGLEWPDLLPERAADLPRGVALAVVNITDCRPLTWEDTGARGGSLLPDIDDAMTYCDDLPALPCYGVEDRWAYVLAPNPRPVERLPVRGMQGWPNIPGPWDPPPTR